MKRHADRKEILDAALGILPENKKGPVLDHINNCTICARQYNLALEMIKPSDNASLKPSDDVEMRLRRSIRTMQKGRIKPEKSTLRTVLRPLALGTAAIMAVFATYFSLVPPADFRDIHLSVMHLKGQLQANELQVKPGNGLSAGSRLATAKDSHAMIGKDSIFTIIFAPESRLTIDTAREETRSGRDSFSFSMNEGMLYAEFNHREAEMEYSFTTPHAVIHSIGTKFLLKSGPEDTTVALTEGRVKITSKLTGETIELEEGNRCVMGKTPATERITENDREQIIVLKNAFNDDIKNANRSDGSSGTEITGKKTIEEDKSSTTAPDTEKIREQNELLENRREQMRNNREMREMRQQVRERRQEQRSNQRSNRWE